MQSRPITPNVLLRFPIPLKSNHLPPFSIEPIADPSSPASLPVIMTGQAVPLLLLFFASIATFSLANPDEEAALLRFKSTFSGPSNALPSWVSNAAPCVVNNTTWVGVICFNGRVRGVHLEGIGLNGRLDLGPLVDLPGLRTLSFMHNKLEGPLPDLRRLGALKAVYLSDNKFSGEIPDTAFAGMRSLKKLFLSRNQFSGPIPTTLARLPRLLEVQLDHNKFAGRIPDFRQPMLEKIDVSFNSLDGAIPESLSKMNSSLFQGNDGLCGAPLSVICEQNSQPKNHLSNVVIALIILALIAGLLLLVIIIILVRRRLMTAVKSHPSANKMNAAADEAAKLEEGLATTSTGDITPTAAVTAVGKKVGKENSHGRLVIVQEGRERFELQDLLRAAAEVLGSGNFGASYKVMLPAGPTMVVKKIKEMNAVGREDFDEHMRRIGRLSHPNILPLIAYFYKKEEKLLVTDFVEYGSLSQMLHGNTGLNIPPLDWPTRLKIVKGAARGLAYLYDELPILTLPHGHLKSSNVLLNASFEPLLADFALAPITNADTASQIMVAYKSPEVEKLGRPTKKSDVWSLGILVLEILTGKLPDNFLHKGSGGGTDLAAWASSAMHDEWSAEVLDGDITRGSEVQGEIRELLKIGLDCCEEEVERRPDMREVYLRIEQINENAT